MGDVKTKRTYNSPLRQLQAEQTRERVADAALVLFEQTGYAATSVAAIARAAGVAAETIYAAFGTKRGVLEALVERTAQQGVAQRTAAAWALQSGHPDRQLAVLAATAREFWGGQRRIVSVLRQGTGDSELAEVWNERQRGRRAVFDGLLAGWPDGAVRAGLDRAAAADIAFALTSADVFHLLVEDAAWSEDVYEARLAELLRRAILAP